jgi:hypothetical protein
MYLTVVTNREHGILLSKHVFNPSLALGNANRYSILGKHIRNIMVKMLIEKIDNPAIIITTIRYMSEVQY